MLKNRLRILLTLIVVFTLSLNIVSAASLIDTQRVTDVYKMSDDTSEFKVPFLRIAQGRIEIDKELSQDGIFISQSGITLTKPATGVQLYYSQDTVRLNSDSEYSAIASAGNVIISGIVEKTTAIYCQGEVTIDEGANVKGNLIVYAAKLNINSKVDGNIIGVVPTLNINNEVTGNVRVRTEEVNITETGKVIGDFVISTYNSNLKVEGATIDLIKNASEGGFKAFFFEFAKAIIVDMIIYLLLLILIKKERLALMGNRINQGRRVLINGLLSFLGIIMSIVFGIVLVILLPKLGIASVTFGIASLIIFTLLKNIIVVTFVTEIALSKYSDAKAQPNRIFTVIVSFVIINLISRIPFIGGLLNIFLFIMAVGMFTTFCLGKKGKEDKKVEVVNVK